MNEKPQIHTYYVNIYISSNFDKLTVNSSGMVVSYNTSFVLLKPESFHT